MDTNEKKQEMENKAFQKMREEDRLKEEGRLRKEESTNRSSRLWVWLGVLLLVFIIIYWLFAIGTFGDLQNWFDG